MRILLYTMSAALTLLPAFAQKYEFGVGGGGSFYQSKTITNTRGNADAGFDNGWAATVYVGNNMYTHIGGELRYSYLHNDLKLSSGSTNATFGGEAHAIHYDFLIHATPVRSSIRPYVAAGGGIKYYRGTGTEVQVQPLGTIALLTKTNQVVGMASVGGGVKFQLSSRVMLRLDVHDYLSPFPKNVITPAAGSSSPSGWINNIVGTAMIVFTSER